LSVAATLTSAADVLTSTMRAAMRHGDRVAEQQRATVPPDWSHGIVRRPEILLWLILIVLVLHLLK
jgi:hypothetical protein